MRAEESSRMGNACATFPGGLLQLSREMNKYMFCPLQGSSVLSFSAAKW